MKLEATDHSYYSSESNFYVGNRNGENFGSYDAENWQQFKEDWLFDDLTIDHDYNHCFRYDIEQDHDYETDEPVSGQFSLKLFFILQRKGIYRPVHVKSITEDDMPEIEEYLKSCWNYLQNQWKEFSQ